MDEGGATRRIPIEQIYKSLVELQSFSAYRLLKMVASVVVTTIVAFGVRIVFNDQDPFSLDIVDMFRLHFDRTFQLGDETTSPVDFITAMWGVVVTICLGVAFQSARFVSDRDAIGDFSGLLVCSAFAMSFITGFWIPERYHTNGIAKTFIITAVGCLLMGWVLNYGSQIYITHRTMVRNERARDVDLRRYAIARRKHAYGPWTVWALVVCVANAVFWLVMLAVCGCVGRLDEPRVWMVFFVSSLLAAATMLLYAYVQQRFVESMGDRRWSSLYGAVLWIVTCVALWYAMAICWATAVGDGGIRGWMMAAVAGWCVVDMVVARCVLCRFVIHPTHALEQDARFTQKTMQWQHYDLFAQLVDSSAIPRYDLSEYGRNLRLMAVPWSLVETRAATGRPDADLITQCASMFFPRAHEDGVPLVAFTSRELQGLIEDARKRHGWQDTPEGNLRACKGVVRCPEGEHETIEATLCFYLTLIFDDINYQMLLQRH